MATNVFYDAAKYLNFGGRSGYSLDEERSRELIIKLLQDKKSQKIFIEPHLVKRLKLNHSKLRFHGCQSVRHDDHIHFQIY